MGASLCRPIEVRLYDHLFNRDDPDTVEAGKTFLDNLNPGSLTVVEGLADPSMAGLEPGQCLQFERLGYFTVDPDSRPDRPVFNRTVTLKDTWAKIEKKDE